MGTNIPKQPGVPKMPGYNSVKTELEKTALLEQVRWERDVAISQLHELGYEFGEKIEQQPCTDAISRQAAIDATTKYCVLYDLRELLEDIETLPSVSTEKTGCWVEIDDEPHEVWECDHCGFVIDGSGCIDPYEYKDIYKYCPSCGAKMEVKE